MKYEVPVSELLKFDDRDVIATSFSIEGEGQTPGIGGNGEDDTIG